MPAISKSSSPEEWGLLFACEALVGQMLCLIPSRSPQQLRLQQFELILNCLYHWVALFIRLRQEDINIDHL